MKNTITLNNGAVIPVLGIGTYALNPQQAEKSVYWALKTGYRLIDTARIYGNEQAVGSAIKRAISEGIVKREELFVTTKMWTADFDYGDAAVNASLANNPKVTVLSPPTPKSSLVSMTFSRLIFTFWRSL